MGMRKEMGIKHVSRLLVIDYFITYASEYFWWENVGSITRRHSKHV